MLKKPMKTLGCILFSAGLAVGCFGGYRIGKNAEIARDMVVENVNSVFYGNETTLVTPQKQGDLALNIGCVGTGLALIASGAVMLGAKRHYKIYKGDRGVTSVYKGKRIRYKING